MPKNKDTPRPGRYATVYDRDSRSTDPAPAGPIVTNNDQILREVRALRDHVDKKFERVHSTMGSMNDRLISHERELASLTATNEAGAKQDEDTGRFHIHTIQRLHMRIDSIKKDAEDLRRKLDENRDRIWKLAVGSALGGGAGGAGVVEAVRAMAG